MKNLNRYYFHPDGMRLDMAQGDNQKGRWVKFYDHVEALRSASDNTERLAIALWKRVVEIAEENHPVDVSLGMLTVLIDEWRSATESSK